MKEATGSNPATLPFDQFIAQNHIPVALVDQFDGYVVDVALPVGWEPFESPPGTRVCVWGDDPFGKQFRANVVLTMTQIEAVLDPSEVFAMLCEAQVQLVPAAHEISRDLGSAVDGPGVAGTHATQIGTDTGLLNCVSLLRMLVADGRTLIAQLTLTALPDSPVDHSNIGMAVTPADSSSAASAQVPGVVTVSATAGDH